MEPARISHLPTFQAAPNRRQDKNPLNNELSLPGSQSFREAVTALFQTGLSQNAFSDSNAVPLARFRKMSPLPSARFGLRGTRRKRKRWAYYFRKRVKIHFQSVNRACRSRAEGFPNPSPKKKQAPANGGLAHQTQIYTAPCADTRDFLRYARIGQGPRNKISSGELLEMAISLREPLKTPFRPHSSSNLRFHGF